MKKNIIKKDKTLLLLIEFEGVPEAQADNLLDEIRYSYLKRLLFEHPATSLLILSDHRRANTIIAAILDHLQDSRRTHTHSIVNITPIKTTMEDIYSIADVQGYNIQNVIVAGCNTTGCVFESMPYSAVKWAQAGHFVQIVLPMCGDADIHGIGPEKYIRSFARLYKKIKKANVFKNVEIVSELHTVLHFNNGVQSNRFDIEPKI